jgi:hypothetical protein
MPGVQQIEAASRRDKRAAAAAQMVAHGCDVSSDGLGFGCG